MSEIALRFDYDSLSGGVATQAAKHAREIKTLTRKAVEDIVKIGDELTAVKGILPHGKFGEWLRVEFAWSEHHANRLMKSAEKAKSLNLRDLDVSASALYLLASDSVPDEAIAEVVEKAKADGKVTHKETKRIIEKHKPKPAPVTLPSEDDCDWGDEETETAVEQAVEAVASDPVVSFYEGDPEEDDTPVKDASGKTIPKHLKDAFSHRPWFRSFVKRLGQLLKECDEQAKWPGGDLLPMTRIRADLRNTQSEIKNACPHAVCPHCRGKGCNQCHDLGWMTAERFGAVPIEKRGA